MSTRKFRDMLYRNRGEELKGLREEKFTIGELSKIFNISTDTLRYYDKVKLIKPEYGKENRYRYYDIRDFFKLSRILFLKNLDIPLAEIRSYMLQKNRSNLLAMLERKETELDEKIRRMQNLKNKIHSKRTLLETVEQGLNQVVIKDLPRRRGVFIATAGDEKAAASKKALMRASEYFHVSSWLIEGQVYTSVGKDHLDKGIYNCFRYFVEIVSDEIPEVYAFPAGPYAAMTVKGPYEEMVDHYQYMMDWIDEQGYTIAGNSLEKNIVDSDFADSTHEYVSEILIPIRKD